MKHKRTLGAAFLLPAILTFGFSNRDANATQFDGNEQQITVELSPGEIVDVDVACIGNSRALGAGFRSEPSSGSNAVSVIASYPLATNEWRVTWQQRSPLDQVYTLTVSAVCISGNP